MNYLLDTSTLIELLRQRDDAWDFLRTHNEDNFLTSCICEAEAWEGVFREKEAYFEKRRIALEELLGSLSKIVTFDSKQAYIAGKIRASLAIRGEKTGDVDVLIAASAIANDSVLLTKNIKHFSRIKNLKFLTL